MAAVRSGSGDDLYFGFAEPHYGSILAQEMEIRNSRTNQLAKHQQVVTEQLTVDQMQSEAKQAHDRRRQEYLSLDDGQRKLLLERALLAAHSNSEYKRIASANIANPPSDVLKALLKHLSSNSV